MRDIRFRAWLTNGDGIEYSQGAHMEYDVTIQKGKYASVEGGWDIQGLYDYPLMQFTGLVDKNGTEIFEGDVVRIRFHEAPDGESFENGVIKWNEDSSGFKWFSGDPSDWHNYWLTQSDHLGREVIGNIYENPTLLATASKDGTDE